MLDDPDGMTATREPRTGWERLVIRGVDAIGHVGWIVFVAVTFGQVIARYVFEVPFQWAEELARFALVWFSFLYSIQLTILDQHIDLGGRPRADLIGKLMFLLKYASILATGLMLVVGVWRIFPVVRTSVLPATGLPMATFYLAGLLAGVGFFGVALIRIVAMLADSFLPRRADGA
jgi:TRAP-type C4-dicarboxylate transport system permease small subunit